MAIICLLSLLPSISVLANENYITDPATSLRGKSDSAVPTRLQQNGKTITGIVQSKSGRQGRAQIRRLACQHYRKRNDKREHYGHGW